MAELGLVATTVDYDTRQLILGYLGLDPREAADDRRARALPESVWADKARLAAEKAFETSIHNTSTPREIALLLEKCVRGEIVDRATSDRVLTTMRSHTGAELILRYLPAARVARKGGSLAKNGEDTVLSTRRHLAAGQGRHADHVPLRERPPGSPLRDQAQDGGDGPGGLRLLPREERKARKRPDPAQPFWKKICWILPSGVLYIRTFRVPEANSRRVVETSMPPRSPIDSTSALIGSP